jgi:chemotaxis protein methyltransferase CheR
MSELLSTFRSFLLKRTGIALEADRDYLVESRLSPLLRIAGIGDLQALLVQAMSGSRPEVTRLVTEAMLTGETFFFRDRQVFQTLRETILSELLEARSEQRRLRIWCAACSTGQEPYSLAMILDEEARRLRGWQIEIIATDLSETAIETARAGLYNQFEVQRGLPVSLLLRYFSRDKDRWRIAEHLRSMIEFRQLNLTEEKPPSGVFDLIFCRNVLMYFDPRTKQDILHRSSSALASDGWLLLGATENTSGLTTGLEPDLRAAGVYRLRKVWADRIVSRARA